MNATTTIILILNLISCGSDKKDKQSSDTKLLEQKLFSKSSSTDSTRPTCEWNKESPKLAESKMSIKFFTKDIKLACNGIKDAPYHSPVPISFVFQGENAAAASNIAFQVEVISGKTAELSSQPSLQLTTPRGVVTKEEDWITNSCGVGQIQILPQCTTKSDVIEVLIHSGEVSNTIKIFVYPELPQDGNTSSK